jgi:hypothetical protein
MGDRQPITRPLTDCVSPNAVSRLIMLCRLKMLLFRACWPKQRKDCSTSLCNAVVSGQGGSPMPKRKILMQKQANPRYRLPVGLI